MSSTTTVSTKAVVVAASATLASAVVSALWIIKAKAQKRVESPIFPGIPYAPGANWFLGHLVMLNGGGDFVQGYRNVFESWADPISGLCSFWFVAQPTLAVLLSHHVKAVLNASVFRQPVKLLEVHNRNFLGEKALVNLMGKEWKLYRTAVHRSFTPEASKESQRSILKVGDTLVRSLLETIKKSETGSLQQQLLPLMKMATMDIFGFVALDVDFQCTRLLKLTAVASAFEHLATEYTRRMTTPWDPTSYLYFIPTAANRKQRAERRVIRTFIAKQIALTRSQLLLSLNKAVDATTATAAPSKQHLLANVLRAAKAEDGNTGGEMSDEAISDIMMTLLFGGYDTTAITLTYALYLLATHPEIQAECLKEVQSVFPTNGDDNDDNAMMPTVLEEGPEQHLQYTRAVILETLRLFPPAPTTARCLEKSMELEGHVLDKGTVVFIPIWSIQRDARNFPKPTELRPERWVRPKQRLDSTTNTGGGGGVWEERPSDDMISCKDVPPANNDAFCVFAAGARNCVGRRLAMQESVTLLAILIRKLKFQVMEDGYQVKPMLASVVQQPDDGLPMIMTPR